jgi:hypothetical protein
VERVDSDKLMVKFYEAGLLPHLGVLQGATYGEKKEALMAFRPALWGVHVWVTGDTFVLCDEKGYLTHLLHAQTTVLVELLRFESTQGPGALRAVLKRPLLDPSAAVQRPKSSYNPKAEVPRVKVEKDPKPLRRRKLSPSDFAKLLGDL